jgi:DNA-binding FadR family transcriptional regulator
MTMPESAATTLHGQVLDAFGLAIVDGEIPHDQSITIEELEGRYSASRSVVRESIRVLESMGMVRARRRVGVEIMPISTWDVYDIRLIHWRLAGRTRNAQLRSLIELRRAIEPEAARLAAARIDTEQVGELMSISARVWAAGTTGRMDDFIAQDVAFHRLLLEQSGNEMFGGLGQLIGELITGRADYGLMPHSHSPRGLQLHLDAANAIQSGNGDAAATAVLAIIDLIMEEMSELWEGTPTGRSEG